MEQKILLNFIRSMGEWKLGACGKSNLSVQDSLNIPTPPFSFFHYIDTFSSQLALDAIAQLGKEGIPKRILHLHTIPSFPIHGDFLHGPEPPSFNLLTDSEILLRTNSHAN